MAKDNRVTVDVTQDKRLPPRFGLETPASMALRFGGGVEGVTAPIEIGTRVIVVLDTEVTGVNHHRKKSDKVEVLERAHSLSVAGGWVVEAEAGLSLVEALRIAREEAHGVLPVGTFDSTFADGDDPEDG